MPSESTKISYYSNFADIEDHRSLSSFDQIDTND